MDDSKTINKYLDYDGLEYYTEKMLGKIQEAGETATDEQILDLFKSVTDGE